MEYVYVGVICAAIAGSVLGALVRGWSILSRLYSLEDRLNIVEGTLSREVKVRAANGRWNKRDAEDAILAAALEKPDRSASVTGQAPLPWWAMAAKKHPREYPLGGRT